jgi:uncharacterized protein (TIGR00730 family)
VCVFCGSALGGQEVYRRVAHDLGTRLAQRGISLVYGGARRGLMGVLADAALEGGAEVIGVMPEAIVALEVAHTSLSKLHVTSSMHERKALMAQLADAFLALPGGYGTFDELFEVLTWAQLEMHDKPIGVLDVAGYFAPLETLIERAVSEGFVRPEHRRLLVFSEEIEDLLDRLADHRPPRVSKLG